MYVQRQWRPEEGLGSLGTGVTGGDGCQELNAGPLENQPVLFTSGSPLSLLSS